MYGYLPCYSYYLLGKHMDGAKYVVPCASYVSLQAWHSVTFAEMILASVRLFSSAFIFSLHSLGIIRLLCFKLSLLSLSSCCSAMKVNTSYSPRLPSRFAFDTWTHVKALASNLYLPSSSYDITLNLIAF